MAGVNAAPAIQELKRRLQFRFGQRFSRLVVYGSVARGDTTDQSDVDTLLVLRQSGDLAADWSAALHDVAEVCLEYDTLISLLVTTEVDFETRQTPLFINVRREGVAA